jgi:DNA-binding NarL/FixJ family response regulator
MIKIALVDDHQLFRKSLSFLINAMEGMQVVYDSDDGNDFLKYIKTAPIDLVLLDIQMPIISGFEVCKLLKEQNPDIKILIISQLTTKEAIHHVMECGANGFFTKNASPELLEVAIQNVLYEGFYFDVGLSNTLREVILWDKKTHVHLHLNPDAKLSEREIQIIKMICQEKSSLEIASFMNITTRTVETHRNRLIKRLKVKNFIGVILHALKIEAIHLDDI